MLVLSRKQGEKLLIGDDIVLTVTRISGNRVAIGIEAPREVPVVRGELGRNEEQAEAIHGVEDEDPAEETHPLAGRAFAKPRGGISLGGMSTPIPSASVSIASKPVH